MKYAEVAVNAPVAGPRTFTYAVPPEISVTVGCAVWVPFGPRTLQGVVFNLTDQSPVEDTREIAEVIGPAPLLSPEQVDLAAWIAEYYCAPYFEAAALMLPPAFARRTLVHLEPSAAGMEGTPEGLTPHQEKTLRFLRENGRAEARSLAKKVVPQRHLKSVLDQLVRKGLITRTVSLEGPRVKPRMAAYIWLAASPDAVAEEIPLLERRRAARQAGLLKKLAESGDGIPLSEALKVSGAPQSAARALEKKGLVRIEMIQVHRDPLAHRHFTPSLPPVLTPAQQAAWERIREGLEVMPSGSPPVFLLHGITGSGKTEIYLRSLAEAVARGRKALVLVPEIALTPQTIERFASRFPGRVAVLHSRLSTGEQFDEWHRIREGDFDVVIGSRGAVFAPQPDLGLIVIDEEHEWTYKQHDRVPLYHAREVALRRAELTGAVVILGSATPVMESYHRARRGDYTLLELPERVGEISEGAFPSLPEVRVVDLREELKSGNRSIFSRDLNEAIGNAVESGGQGILFLNRRGAASFVQCRDCGHVMRCRRCDTAMTHHIRENHLICHLCNYRIPPPALCPECGSARIKYLGIGTQKVEEETARAFPEARLLRWDRDVTGGKYSHEEILRRFQSHEADILIGTQMIAKGLDIPLVTVVGVISADVGLHLPDFRAAERTFQLLSQVTGRAGRGPRGGLAIIQTYTPEHYAIRTAAAHDFASFYDQERALRHEYGYPPFGRLVTMTYSSTSNERGEEEARRMARLLQSERDSQGIASLDVTGPTPAFTPRIRGRYRWQVTVRGPDPMPVVCRIPFPQGWVVDVDPVGI